MKSFSRKVKDLAVAFLVLQGAVMAGTAESMSAPVPTELIRVLENIIDILTNKAIVIPASIIAGAIGLYELMFSGSRGGEKLGKALIGGALVLALASIVRSAFGV